MRHAILIAFFAGVCVAAQPGDEAVKKELKTFEGKWEALAAQNFDGTVPTDVELQIMALEVEGDQFTMKTGSLTVKGTIKLDPTKKPKVIDIYFGNGAEPSLKGIYEVKDGVRKSCFAEPKKDRPTEFKKEKGYMYLEWRKAQ